MDLIEDLKNNCEKLKVGILGLSYIGLPLAVSFSLNGVNVIGYDASEDSAAKVNTGTNYIDDVAPEDLKKVVDAGKLKATIDFSRIAKCRAILICDSSTASHQGTPHCFFASYR